MSGEARISEREAVMRERAAFIVGACDTTFATRDGARDDAERRYPLPKVERPRVLLIEDSAYRAVDGRLQWQHPLGDWRDAMTCAVKHVPAFAALLANPTELVDDDGEPDPGVSS